MTAESFPVLETRTSIWPDISFAAVAESHAAWVDFSVYHILGMDGEASETPLFQRAGLLSHPHPVLEMAEAEIYLHGSVKWDGCSNWSFDEQERVMLHFCQKESAVDIGTLLGRLYDTAAEMLPNWDGDE